MLARPEDALPDADASCLYRSIEARLRPFIARRVPPADVDDVMQDVFLRMTRGLGALRDEDRFGAWMFQVARSAIAEHRIGRARHPLVSEDAEEEAADPDERGGDDVERDLALYVAPLIALLPEPYAEALTLTEIQGLKQKEAAARLGISLAGMKSRVKRGREQLRALLERCCSIALDARGHVIECEPRAVDPAKPVALPHARRRG